MRIGNRMKASALPGIWARVTFFKFCSHVLFQPINCNLVTGKPIVNFQENVYMK